MFNRLKSLLPKPLKVLALRFESGPIADTDDLCEFIRTRSAYVGQTALYGYLKTRMGTKFRLYFEDVKFSIVIRNAALKVFEACLADFTIFSVARVCKEGNLRPGEAAALARHIYRTGIERTLEDGDIETLTPQIFETFDERTENTIWANAAIGENAFADSIASLVRHAPVVEEFRESDEEIIRNSVRFRWRDPREQFLKRIDPVRLSENWRAKSAEIKAAGGATC